jgi:hypothetical protein
MHLTDFDSAAFLAEEAVTDQKPMGRMAQSD